MLVSSGLFQSTHPRGVRPISVKYFSRGSLFQSTHPRGVRQAKIDAGTNLELVSIHAPAWGATLPIYPKGGGSGCFNPRTRVGCDGSVPSAVCNTSEFQSTHPRGVRPYYSGRMVAIIEFQSTHPRGVRPHAPGGSDPLDLVSIHAPAGGATRSQGVGRRPSCVSIHAPAWGATLPPSGVIEVDTEFQSTHPRGVRRIRSKIVSSRGSFNPRTRVGCDAQNGIRWRVADAFQSTHPRGVRPALGLVKLGDFHVSIHAPAWGATRTCRAWRRRCCRFNPRTRVGCDGRGRFPALPCSRFQSTHPRGARRTPRATSLNTLQFQSTHPRGVRR